MVKKRVFLDYASATPQSPEVTKEILKASKTWANPSSLHEEGERAKNILEEARIKIARILHCRASEIFFTSGGTEALNIAILGTVKGNLPAQAGIQKIPHIITSTIEHPAVLEPIKQLVKNGEAEASFVAPDEKGIIKPESIKRELKNLPAQAGNTVLVVIQHANNEIGTIQPVREISKIIKAAEKNSFRSQDASHISPQESSQPLLLVDASQSVCYEDVSLERLGADILILDGMKMYGPRGAGILAVKRSVAISPVFFGGGQERGLKPGTQNVSAVAGLAKALEIAARTRDKESARLKKLRDYAIQKILNEIPNSLINGDLEKKIAEQY